MNVLWNDGYYFNDSKYTHTYFRLIHNAQAKYRNKTTDTYFESHHIIPRSIERGSSATVLLTAKEHFICHLLLTRMCLNANHYYKMLNAFQMMCNVRDIGRCTAAIYQRLKSEVSSAKRILTTGEKNPFYGKTHTPEVREILRAKMLSVDISGDRNPNFGKRWTAEQKEAASELKRNLSDVTRQRMSDAQKGKVLYDEHREKLRIAGLGRVFTPETKERIRQSKLGSSNPNFGKKYDEAYKRNMSETISQIQNKMLAIRARLTYDPVIAHYGEFTPETVLLAKTQGVIIKQSFGYLKVASILNL